MTRVLPVACNPLIPGPFRRSSRPRACPCAWRTAKRIGSLISICNKCEQFGRGFLDKLIQQHARHAQSATLAGRARRIEVKKIVPFVVAAGLGLGLAGAAEAGVSVGIGLGVPIAPAYPVYAAPPPVYYAPPAPVYAPPVVVAPAPVVVGGYYGYGHPYYRGYYHGHGYYRGYYGHPYYRR
jgi:hypothetical protein